MHNQLRYTLELLFRGLAVMLFVALIACLLLLFVSPLIVLAPFVLLLFVQLSRRFRRNLRRRRAMMVLGYLDQAVRLNMPLAQMIDAAARSERGILNFRLTNLRDRIATGEPLHLALLAAVPEMPQRIAAMVGFGEQVGRLPQLLGHVSRSYTLEQRDQYRPGQMAWIYTVNVLLILATVMTAMMIFIVPKFERIFQDFDQALPKATENVIRVGIWMSGAEGQTVPGALLLVLAAFAVMVLVAMSRLPAGAAVFEPLYWRLPLIHGLQRDRGMADICRALTEAASSGVPLPTAIHHASNLRVNRVLGKRLSQWGHGITAGQTPADAARAAGLPSLMVGLLATARGRDDLHDVFQYLSRYYAARYSRTTILVQSAAEPVMVIGLAVIVAWFVVGMFLPLVDLIWQMTGATWLS